MGDLAIFDIIGADWIPHWLRVIIILVLIVGPALLKLVSMGRDMRKQRLLEEEEIIADAVSQSEDTQALIIELLKSIQVRLNTMYFTLHNTNKGVGSITESLKQDNEDTVAAFETIYDELVELNKAVEKLWAEVLNLKRGDD